MARFTSAFSSFSNGIQEINLLISSAAQKERKDPVRYYSEIRALCRGAIVLLTAHIEAYVKEVGEITLDAIHTKRVERAYLHPRLYYHISKNAIDEIQDTSDSEKIAEKIFSFINNDSQYWSRSGPFPIPIDSDRFNKGFSNPAFEKVAAYLGRFGHKTYKNELAKSLKANYAPTINTINHLVDTRNKIAHGDPNVTETPLDLKGIVKTAQLFCRTTDSVFASWCSKNICKIR